MKSKPVWLHAKSGPIFLLGDRLTSERLRHSPPNSRSIIGPSPKREEIKAALPRFPGLTYHTLNERQGRRDFDY